jgi:murein DD-endopeptidase MepM/ murein hydrolase activator NlpD
MGLKDWMAKLKDNPISDVIKHKHRFVVMDTDTFKEKFSFQLSGINLFVTVGITVIVLIVLTTVLIAFTPLREMIPGYTDTEMVEQTYENAHRVDSLETELANQEWMVATIQAILSGQKVSPEFDSVRNDTTASLQQVAKAYRHSMEDSLLRIEVEQEDNQYQVKVANRQSASPVEAPTVAHLFFAPMKGNIVAGFDANHPGVDIAGSASQPVTSAYRGTVVFAGFTVDEGHVIVLQHPGNVLTVYKDNGALLKHRGDVVRAGEPIAYIGTTGRRELGPHLHFEIWVSGIPVNPEEYISF